ncbi:hypothetical protein OG2516_15015 [Oceanicola granulosus HTCC2516]|uniref:Tyrosine-protein kinase G-rich domain-containing protein n=1 Tax=Oceanicola granulosus (strain ATCC BAA-861 / DSM 15982 / KCTC 12143 / HTCC2516) TaxID=314256 RepID=Q2CER2_OCEGH|nr:GNVR domain-containing protein [Oceanicola granulosus]EAR51196.1 hypothetical protein OG2516_15015 [Oceanicola granulosus HTCC2516]
MTNSWDMPADTGADGRRQTPAGPSLLALAWMYKLPILLAALVAAVATYLALTTVAPTYTARTQVLLNPATTSALEATPAAAEPRLTPAAAQSTVILMESTDVLRAVAEALALEDRPDFNPALRDPAPLDELKERVREAIASVVSPGTETEAAPIAAGDPLAGVLRELRRAVDVRVVGESAIVEVRASARSPSLAAAIADAVAETYIEQELAGKYDSGARATEWLEERTGQLRETLLAADERVTDFRREQLSEGGQSVASLEPRLEELTAQVTRLTAERADLAARRDEVVRLAEEGNYMSLVPLLDIPSISALHAEYIAADSEYVDLQARFGDSPAVTSQRQLRDGLAARLEAEVQNVRAGLDVRLDLTTQRLAAAEDALAEMRRDLLARQQAELRLAELEREAEASRQVYNRFLVRLTEMRESSQFQTPSARIVSRAEVPVAPAAPQKSRMAAVAGMGGGALVLLLLALLRDNQPRVRDADEAAEIAGVDAVQQIPALRGGDASPFALLHRTRARPDSVESESVHRLRYRLRARDPAMPNVVFVTSPRGVPGKSGLCLALAESFAQSGASTALVNIDEQAEDLVTLEGSVAMQDMPFKFIDYTEHTLRGLSEGGGEPAGDLAHRLRVLKRRDVIIINGPSVLRSTDALEVSEMAGRVLLVCNWNETPSHLLRQSVDALRSAGARVDAVAIDRVPRRSMKRTPPLPHAPRSPKAIPPPVA